MLVKDQVLKLKRRYKFINKHRYFYNKRSDLKSTSNKIMSWSIIQTKNRGVFIFEFPFLRKDKMSVQQWTKLWTTKIKKKETLFKILTDTVLPNISVRYNDNWRYVDLIGWTIANDRKRANHSKVALRNKSEAAKNVKRV